MSQVVLTAGAAPPTPSTGKVGVFVDTSGQLCQIDDAGVVTPIAQGAFGWGLVHLPAVFMPAGSTAPTLTAIGSGATIKSPAYIVGDTAYFAFTLPPGAKSAGNLVFVAHWRTSSTDTNTVKWEITYATAIPGGAISADTVVTAEAAGSGVAWQGVSIVSAVQSPSLVAGSLVVAQVKRITNGGTDNADTVFLDSIEVAFEIEPYAQQGQPT